MKCGKSYSVSSTNAKMAGSGGKMPYAGSYKDGGVVAMNNDRAAVKFLNEGRRERERETRRNMREEFENDRLAARSVYPTETQERRKVPPPKRK